jgi:N,N-dimethylformamidase
MLSVHPEYWTRQMYDGVKRCVTEQGGRLLYLGGNGMNWEWN